MIRTLIVLLFFVASGLHAADFGDIPANLSMGAGQSVRRNAGDTLFEAYTGGTVTSFSSGNLSPLFTTSVTNSTTTPALSFTLSNAAAHTFFANNTGSTGAPSFTSFVAGTDYWDTTVFTGSSSIGLVPQATGVPTCLRFLDENGSWTCASGGSSGGAPDDAHYLTDRAESGLTNEVNLGALTTGLLKITVAGSIATPSSITDNSSNWDTAFTDRLKWDGGATGLVAATGRTSLGGTTIGQNFFTLTNPSAVTWARINADNTVTTRTASETRTDLSLVVGTNVQAWDADLDTWATITPASGIGTFLATPSSANLKTAVTDETGSGALVFATSPTLVTPLLGTPTSGTLTNCTGYTEANLSMSDITTNNVSITQHGFAPKAPNDATKFLNGTGAYSVPAGGAGVANPGSQLLGLTAINGSASTALRSDGAPALDQSIVPTWTGQHTWKFSDAVTNSATDVLTVGHNSTGTALDGFGTAILFTAETSTTDDQPQTEIQSVWSTAAHATAKSALRFRTRTGGSALSTRMTLTGAGGLFVGGNQETTANGIVATVTGGGFIADGTTPSSGVFLQSDGTKHINSTYALPTSPSTAGKLMQSDGTSILMSTPTWPTASGAAGYQVRSDGTNFASYPTQIINSSTTSQSSAFASDTYLTGSSVVVTAGDFKAKGQYRCVFDMVKTNAGTAAMTIDVRIGTLGTTGDTSRITFTFGNGTGTIDTGTFEVIVNWRSVGSGTSAVVSGICRAQHNLATTGLFNNAAAWTIVGTVSGGFASNTATTMGLSVNGGTSFSGTVTTVQATLEQ